MTREAKQVTYTNQYFLSGKSGCTDVNEEEGFCSGNSKHYKKYHTDKIKPY